jgi:hypothetical protein
MLILFMGSLLVILACCGAMLFAVNASGKPLPGGCGKDVPESANCENCPNRDRARESCPVKGENT